MTWRDVTDRYRAEQAVVESQSRYRLLAENATDVVFEVGVDGAITWASPSASSVLGRTPEDLVGMPVWALIPEGALPEVRERWYGTGQGLAPVLKADGSTLWGSFRVTTTKGPDGEPTGAIVGMTDVTAVVEANEVAAAARAREARNQLSMDEAAIGILLADLDGVVTYANPALHQLIGLPDGALVGLSVVAASPDDEQPRVREILRQRRGGGVGDAHQRRRLGHSDGTMIWADTFLSPLRDQTGVIDGLMAQIVDVTAEVANREALIRNAEHFRLLAENASDVVYETDRAGHIAWVSPSVLPALGWEPASLVGTLALDLIHADDRDWVTRERAEVYRGDGQDRARRQVRQERRRHPAHVDVGPRPARRRGGGQRRCCRPARRHDRDPHAEPDQAQRAAVPHGHGGCAAGHGDLECAGPAHRREPGARGHLSAPRRRPSSG